MMVTLFMMLVVVMINLAIPVCIGVFVYRDAKQRGMEAILWMLIAVLIPGFIGLIVYLFARTRYSPLRCARCGAAVEETYAVCPQCGTNLRANCPSCGRAVQSNWQVCAHCGAPLNQKQESNIVEAPAVGKSLWVALGIVVLLVFLILFFVASNLIWYWLPNGIHVMHRFL